MIHGCCPKRSIVTIHNVPLVQWFGVHGPRATVGSWRRLSSGSSGGRATTATRRGPLGLTSLYRGREAAPAAAGYGLAIGKTDSKPGDLNIPKVGSLDDYILGPAAPGLKNRGSIGTKGGRENDESRELHGWFLCYSVRFGP